MKRCTNAAILSASASALSLYETSVRHSQQYNPTKIYRYSYMPDPRKFAPIEKVAESELFPMPLRPPHAEVPTVEAFLERITVRKGMNCAEHASSFESWEHLMTASRQDMHALGIPGNVAVHIMNWQRWYRMGYVPARHNKESEQDYWSQYKRTIPGSKQRYQEVPENYRPHQQGIATRPVKDLTAANVMPDWAVEEEKRLAEKRAS
eukprot:PhM_4_TR12881/c0_g1_i1/m.36463